MLARLRSASWRCRGSARGFLAGDACGCRKAARDNAPPRPPPDSRASRSTAGRRRASCACQPRIAAHPYSTAAAVAVALTPRLDVAIHVARLRFVGRATGTKPRASSSGKRLHLASLSGQGGAAHAARRPAPFGGHLKPGAQVGASCKRLPMPSLSLCCCLRSSGMKHGADG